MRVDVLHVCKLYSILRGRSCKTVRSTNTHLLRLLRWFYFQTDGKPHVLTEPVMTHSAVIAVPVAVANAAAIDAVVVLLFLLALVFFRWFSLSVVRSRHFTANSQSCVDEP